MGPRLGLLLALLAVAGGLPGALGGLVDHRLTLPGRPRPGGDATASAAAGGEPDERYGYFSPASNPARKLFYWFYQARNLSTGAAINSSTTPVIAWFNGGPGCSSLWGMFFENGPYTLTGGLQLAGNPYTWAGVGHMIFVDQPIGTGLSYSTQKGDATTTLLDVAQTVTEFFQALFKAPAYASLARNPFYLTGESFAGHYLPAIGGYMRLKAPRLPLAGVAMGNPCTNAPAMYASYPEWALAKRLIDKQTYAKATAALASCKLQAAVCSELDRSVCGDADSFCDTKLWDGVVGAPTSRLAHLNVYNILDDAQSCGTDAVYDCYAPLDARAEAWINANRAALGAPAGLAYKTCADPPYYALVPDMAASYDALVGALVDGGVPVMVYSGEADFVCNSFASRAWLDGLVWSRQAAWRSATYQAWAGGIFKRVGALSFARVRGAGHMVPLDRPAIALQMLQQWIDRGQPTALPS